MRLEIETPSPNSSEIIAACSQLNSPAASICSVANLFAQLNCYCDRLNARPVYTRQSLMQTMQYKHLLCRTSYAIAPLMQTMQEHQLLCRTYNAKHRYAKHLLMQTPAANFPPMSRSLLETPTRIL